MQQLPKAVEYALKILTCLARAPGRPTSAREVARCVGIPPSQAAKLLHFLSWAGLTRSHRGSRGGYSLKRSPSEIHAEQVVTLFQPPPEDSEAPPDPVVQLWQQTLAGSQQLWEQLTIADLASRAAGQWECPACDEEKQCLSAASVNSAAE